MESGRELSGMRKYCMNCPKLQLVFERDKLDDYDQPMLSGVMFAVCWDYYMYSWYPEGSDEPAAIASEDFGRKICQKDDLKYSYDCVFPKDRIPKSIELLFEKYVDTHECPLTKELMQKEKMLDYCPFWVERSMEEWNKD